MRSGQWGSLAGILFIVGLCLPGAAQAQWGFKRVSETDPALPRVLLVGDSIVGGYNGGVAALLKDKANVDYYMTGANLATPGFNDALAKVLGDNRYAVVHFNESGLHAWPTGRIPEGQYGPLMRAYVAMIREQAPQAKLIWATNTPVTVKGEPSRLDPEINPRVIALNEAARPVIVENEITVNDLYTLMLDKLGLGAGDQFHWTQAGRDVQAEAVAGAVLKALTPAEAPQP